MVHVRTINNVIFTTTCGNVFQNVHNIPPHPKQSEYRSKNIYFRNLMTGFIASGAVGGNGMVHTYTNNNNENVHFVHTFSINILKTETNRYFVFQVKNSVI